MRKKCCALITLLSALTSSILFADDIVTGTIDETMPDSIPAEIIADWKDQDSVTNDYTTAIDKIRTAIPEYADRITGTGEEGYLQACHWRRVARMKPFSADIENIMFARHHNFGSFEVGYHDNSDAAYTDDGWTAKGALCILTMKTYYAHYRELYTRTDACVRDPCISFDGRKVLFAVSGNKKGSGYKIFEMEIADTSTLRQLTFNPDSLPTVADFEPCYLPNGDIMFTSTRNFGQNDDSYYPVTNMFLMNGEGKHMRQVGFDQMHTFYPTLMKDGTVLYTRWEFNDRDMTSSMGLFGMNPDGSHQTEYFGNQTYWPLTFIHARQIPGSDKVIAVAGAHHGPYSGELVVINRSKGTNGLEPLQMIAPMRAAAPVVQKSDMATGSIRFLFQNPWPLDETNFLVSWRKAESVRTYGLYFMNADGGRELLASADQSVSQPMPITPRQIRSNPVAVQTNYHDSEGVYTMQDVYYGPGMQGVARGTAKSLRVIALHYRVSGIGSEFGITFGSAPRNVFQPAVSCPVSAYGASWDAKEVLGEAKIYPDGSASFKVPARTPVYFQVIDTGGYCIATMRSWSTLMPGETFSCYGCHENKVEAPPARGVPDAKHPEPLATPLGIEKQRFDYGKMVQPIFDQKCIGCHTQDHSSGFNLTGTLTLANSKYWTASYTSLTKNISQTGRNDALHICTIFSQPEQQQPYSFGSSLSGIMLTGGMSGSHHDVSVTPMEKGIVACWIDLCAPYAGYYNSHMSESDSVKYAGIEHRREIWAAIEKNNIRDLLASTGTLPVQSERNYVTSAVMKNTLCYNPVRQTLELSLSGLDRLTLVDLNGRTVYHKEFADSYGDRQSVTLPPSISRGIYIARFSGRGQTLQRLVSILR